MENRVTDRGVIRLSGVGFWGRCKMGEWIGALVLGFKVHGETDGTWNGS